MLIIHHKKIQKAIMRSVAIIYSEVKVIVKQAASLVCFVAANDSYIGAYCRCPEIIPERV